MSKASSIILVTMIILPFGSFYLFGYPEYIGRIIAGLISISIFRDLNSGDIVGGTIGWGPGATPIGASGTYSSTTVFTLRNLINFLFDNEKNISYSCTNLIHH